MDKKKHITILSLLLIAYDSLLFILGIGFLKGFSMLGSFVGDATADLVLSSIGTIAGSVLLIVSIPGIIAGIGLIYLKSWGRILGLIVCGFKLFNLPPTQL